MNWLCPAFSKVLAHQINHNTVVYCIVLYCWCTRHGLALSCLQQGAGTSHQPVPRVLYFVILLMYQAWIGYVMSTARCWHITSASTSGTVGCHIIDVAGINWLCPTYSKVLAHHISQYLGYCILSYYWCSRHELAMSCLQQGAGTSHQPVPRVLYFAILLMYQAWTGYVLPTARCWHITSNSTMGSVLCCIVCWCSRHGLAMSCLQQEAGMSD